ncbi:hypothetical protein C8J56DRAFT_154925 [Mycena floridula]|nr:hypothetical protein C8J56DRAFT_154925 [Mycena floridula]
MFGMQGITRIERKFDAFVSNTVLLRRVTDPPSDATVTSLKPSAKSYDSAPAILQCILPKKKKADFDDEARAEKLETDFRWYRGEKRFDEALHFARKALLLRQAMYDADQDSSDKKVALAQAFVNISLIPAITLGNSDLDRGLEELCRVLRSSARLYRQLCKESDFKKYRIEQASALHNLSNSMNEAAGRLKDITGHRNAARIAERSAISYFTGLNDEDPKKYGTRLAQACLNLSYILTDCKEDDLALSRAFQAQQLCSRLQPGDIHKSYFVRVSKCLRNVGRSAEADSLDEQLKSWDA